LPVAIAGTEGTLSLTRPGVHRTAVRVWVEPPLDPADYRHAADPLGAMTDAWWAALDRHLAPWFGVAEAGGAWA
jgi:hypothetical protein